jgi:hypothetical protein
VSSHVISTVMIGVVGTGQPTHRYISCTTGLRN